MIEDTKNFFILIFIEVYNRNYTAKRLLIFLVINIFLFSLVINIIILLYISYILLNYVTYKHAIFYFTFTDYYLCLNIYFFILTHTYTRAVTNITSVKYIF